MRSSRATSTPLARPWSGCRSGFRRLVRRRLGHDLLDVVVVLLGEVEVRLADLLEEIRRILLERAGFLETDRHTGLHDAHEAEDVLPRSKAVAGDDGLR